MGTLKKLCPVHCYHYDGLKCPFCEKDRLEAMAHKFVKAEEPKVKEVVVKDEQREVTMEDLLKLKEKFSVKL